MSRHEQTLSVEAGEQLAAIDAALRGEAVAAEHAPLAELALALRSTRPRPREGFAAALDARAARRFKRAPGWSRRGVPRRPRRLLAKPALGVALAAIIALAVVLPLSLQGGSTSHGPVPVGAPQSSGQAAKGAGGSASGAIAPSQAAGSGRTSAAPALPVPGLVVPGPREIVQTVALDIGVAPATIQSTAQRVFTVVDGLGGYVAQSSVSSGGGGATFDLRIPSGRLSSAIPALLQLGHVRSETNTTSDVTDELRSLRGSLADALAQRDSLRAQLARTSDPQQVAVLEVQLRALEERIAGLQAALGGLTAQVRYADVALSLTPETQHAVAAGDLTPGGAARDAARVLDAALAVLVIAAAAVLPVALIAAAGWIAITMARRRLREQALDAG